VTVTSRDIFFFQAEDGIRDRNVTGVQTCALPISSIFVDSSSHRLLFKTADGTMSLRILMLAVVLTALLITVASILQNMGYVYLRSEERRVGKECRSRSEP